ncbi:hypothetical protein DRO55_04440 [Candidatus Bathyarchaeota archaeon]|nr:MAG: hypothetical protein DRO55_04440 [Candidatus Bathyarchaeota archaeon]
MPCVGFDIETYSPRGFPDDYRDPVVAATLATSIDGDVRDGLVLISLIYPPYKEEILLRRLYEFFDLCMGNLLLTYNGLRFDLKYIVNRGEIYGIDFRRILYCFRHLDLYRVIKRSGLSSHGYGQKTIERFLGIHRIVEGLSGASYHKEFQDFLRSGCLRPLIYNIEDAVGCLKILNRLSRSGRFLYTVNSISGVRNTEF